MALSNRRERIGGAVAALAVTGGLGVALVLGLAVRSGALERAAEIALFSVAPDKPKLRRERMPERNMRPSGAAAPPNLRSRATALVVPSPVVPIVLQPLMTVTEKAADGAQATSGAAPVAGPGTGAGGVGDGVGGGGDGDGDGDGAGDPDAMPPRQIGGRIRDSDYPENLADAGVGGVVTVLYVVEVNGRVPECEVLRSSGTARLDALTCRLIRERFRFRPSRDGKGRAVASQLRENHEWVPPQIEP